MQHKRTSSTKQKGQGLTEYLILVAIIAIGTLGIVRVLGQNISAQFASVAYAIQGKKVSVQKSAITDSQTKIKDLGSFLDGAASSDQK